jgi:hypothetical protein
VRHAIFVPNVRKKLNELKRYFHIIWKKSYKKYLKKEYLNETAKINNYNSNTAKKIKFNSIGIVALFNGI